MKFTPVYARWAILFAVLALAACTTSAPSWCLTNRPTRLSDAVVDVMTDAEVKKALADNRKGQALCAWRP